jgi:prepilin-type N-terminal cleavage/methylation domain-containing protein
MPCTPARRSLPERRKGFTLIELLAVIVILSILMAFLVVNLGGAIDAADESFTRTRIAQLEAAIKEYENEHGDFPSSAFSPEHSPLPNQLNQGAEALVLALWSPSWQGGGLSEDWLVNTDGDRSSKKLASFPVADLFEIGDQWGNPMAYFHNRDYGRADTYAVLDPQSGEELEAQALAQKSSKTERYHNPRGVQLISAGMDGEFGTADDISNFER